MVSFSSFRALFVLFFTFAAPTVNIALEDNQIGTIEVDSLGNQAPAHHRATRRPTSQPSAVGIKIKNSRNEALDYYWFNGHEGQLQGRIRPRGVTATNSYEGHVFYMTPRSKPEEELFRFAVNKNENLYLVPPDDSIPMTPEDENVWNNLLQEKQFMQSYRNRTGRPWLAHYPRNPPILPMWSADYIGQIHTITTNHSYWNCIPANIESMTEEDLENNLCRSTSPTHDTPISPPITTIEVEVISLEPRAFLIKNTISDVEADLIISLAKPKIKRSLAGQDGGMVTNTRTSFNTWLNRRVHPILDTLYHRAADILGLDFNILNANSEELQVLNYQVGQEYTSHHDFGASGRPEQRMITLLFYLNNQLTPNAGGETSFPKANIYIENEKYVDNKDGVLKVHPGKGNSVLFYSMLEDGNADDLSLHAATPVKQGEKWLCNFWVWDPKRR